MALRIELYTVHHIEQVRSFNARLRRGKVDPSFLLPESITPQNPECSLDQHPHVAFAKRQFLAVDEGQVRGAFLLQEQDCEIGGQTHWCANIQMPVSEGLVDRNFSYVATRMLQILLRQRAFVFAVGMGSIHSPFARLLSAMNWRVGLVPFRFIALRPARFLQQIQPLHSSQWRSLLANVAARSGLGTAAIAVAQRVRTRHSRPLTPRRIQLWNETASSLWIRYRRGCSFAAVRDVTTLSSFLNLNDSRLLAYDLVDRTSAVKGWMLLQVTSMHQNKYFGSLRVATLLDSVCEPSFEGAAVRAALRCARAQHADLLVSNQQHDTWLAAMAQNGFWAGPSNYVFATSPELTRLIAAPDPKFERAHLSRADGDGRLHL